MESIGDLLGKKNLDQPSEIESLKQFIISEYSVEPKIKVNDKAINLYLPNSSMASIVRMRYREIERRCQLTRKLYVRIG